MLVSDVLNIVKSKALGRDNYKPDQEFLLLNFFNLAHFQLWDAIANLDDAYLLSTNATISTDSQIVTTTGNVPIKARIKVLNASGKELKQVSQIYFAENPQLSNDKNYYFLLSKSSFQLTYTIPEESAETIPLLFFYTPEAQPLGLNDDLNLVYPEVRLQYLLSDGTFYHLCFSEEGTRPTRQQDKSALEWSNVIMSEQASLMNAQPFSTQGMW